MVGFQSVVPAGVEGDLQVNQVEVKVKEVPSEGESTPPLPSFRLCPDTTKEYNFDYEVVKLPFKFNLWNAPMSKEQQGNLLNLVHDN